MCDHLHEHGECCGECDKPKKPCLKIECNYGDTGKCTYFDYEPPMAFPEFCPSEELL